MFCSKCGKPLKNENKFCPACGNAVPQENIIEFGVTTRTKSTNKWMLVGVFLCVILLFGGVGMYFLVRGQGTDKILNESTIKEDIQNADVFAEQNLYVSSFEIIERQTNIANKEDIVYVHVGGNNSEFSVIRNYKITYTLSKDGWEIENIEAYEDDKYCDETIPLKGVSKEVLSSHFEKYKEDSVSVAFEEQLEQVTYGEIVKVDGSTYTETYRQINVYEYTLFTNEVTITSSFRLSDFTWVAETEYDYRPMLKRAVYGKWYEHAVVGYDPRNGNFVGEGDIYVSLTPIKGIEEQVECTVSNDIWTKDHSEQLGFGTSSGLVALEVVSNQNGQTAELLLYKHNMYEDKKVKITSEGLFYCDSGIEWRLTKSEEYIEPDMSFLHVINVAGKDYNFAEDFHKVVGNMVKDDLGVVDSMYLEPYDEHGEIWNKEVDDKWWTEKLVGRADTYEAFERIVCNTYVLKNKFETKQGLTKYSSLMDIGNTDGFYKIDSPWEHCYVLMFMDDWIVELEEYKDELNNLVQTSGDNYCVAIDSLKYFNIIPNFANHYKNIIFEQVEWGLEMIKDRKVIDSADSHNIGENSWLLTLAAQEASELLCKNKIKTFGYMVIYGGEEQQMELTYEQYYYDENWHAE